MKAITLIVSIFISFNTIAINQIDSLKLTANKQKDSVLVDTYYNIVKYYLLNDHQPDSMVKYSQLAVNVSTKNNLTSRIIKTKKALGLSYTEANKIDLAKATLTQALELATKEKNTTEIIAINEKLGYLYGKTNQVDKSVYYFLNIAKEYEKQKNYEQLGITYSNIVVLFRGQYQPDKVLFYSRKSLETIPKMNRNTSATFITEIYSKVALNYFNIGEKEKNSSLIDTALIYADSCLNVSKAFNIKDREADVYYIFSHNYRLKKDYQKTISFAQKALSFKNFLPEERIFNIYISLAQTYFETGQNDLSQHYIDSCYTLETSKQSEPSLLLFELEYNLYKKKGSFEKALTSLEKYNSLKKTIQDEERNKNMNDLETKYQTELKESRISELNKQKEIDNLRIKTLIASIGITVLIILVIIFFYRQSVVKNKLNSIQTEQRLNRARMNPHFFFNVLATLQTLILEEVEATKIALMTSKFSKIMRQSLESTYSEMVYVEQEIEFISNYIDIQRMRFEDKFSYEIIVDEKIQADSIKVPSMLIQPFIENSIEHGFKDLNYNGELKIYFTQEENNIKIICADNGKGFSSSIKHKGYPSRATQIVKERLTLLNKQLKCNAHSEITSSDKGTTIIIYLPIIL